ncbi:indolethylamine N-methyltransferase-like [Anomaloglossus baeobatrachus]|uniref:indolethylamine N-methyltransferase-like n=1 Tax=Anomaloglossus baeobatrachus TaxID=238106 RepID=UPI003F50B168
MDSCSYKLYHIDGLDSRKGLETYFSGKEDMVFGEDTIIFPIENITKTFTKGHIKGDVLIDFSFGPLVHHLFAACDFFKHIIVLKIQDRCIMELKRWVDERTGAFDWGHAAKCHVDNKESSEQTQERENKVRSALQHVVKCNLGKDNMVDPILLPPADCIITAVFCLLEFISKDKDEYMRNVRKFSQLLKPGGHIILIGCLEATYATAGKHKYHLLNHDEDFVRKALVDAGFVIDNCKVKKRTNVSDLIDYKAGIFIAAHKDTV